MMLAIINLILALASSLISFVNLLIVKKKTKEAPYTWYYLSIGFFFIFLSQIVGYFRTLHQQPAYFLQYYTESVAIIGVFFTLRGLLIYLGKSK
ncbi:MAG: hypothetical protein NZ942_00830 [Candidatus Aenigmarchaeota archaeon]|nr:hypothetical protein [Candidatus Aenigmarchaeota archaeon]